MGKEALIVTICRFDSKLKGYPITFFQLKVGCKSFICIIYCFKWIAIVLIVSFIAINGLK